MNKTALLNELRSLIDRVPDFSVFHPTSKPHQTWLAKARYLLCLDGGFESISIEMSFDSIAFTLSRDSSLHKIIRGLYSKIDRLEREICNDSTSSQVFGPGAVYDFSAALRDLISSTKNHMLIIDPWLDEDIFDYYLAFRPDNAHVDLLTKSKSPTFVKSASMYIEQFGQFVTIRTSKDIHDRVIFIDKATCYVMGNSIKNAAQTQTTYLAPLSSDVVELKWDIYQSIWQTSTTLCPA